MKKLLHVIFVSLLMFSCVEKNNNPEPPKFEPTFYAEAYLKTKSNTGEVTEVRQSLAVMHLWNAEGRTFEIKDAYDGLAGYAYDMNTKERVPAATSIIGASSIVVPRQVRPGRYFISIHTHPDIYPKGIYSSRYVEFKAGNNYSLKKVFSENPVNYSYEVWE